ncbi:MAG: class II aldolase/adducin family protein [Actinomycetota bacterium]
MISVDDFRLAGRTLFSFGLVRDTDGNLSVFDGTTITITRTGASLASIDDGALVAGTMDDDLPGASTDLQIHRRLYRQRGPGAIVHAHPPGTVPEEAAVAGEHGTYTFGPSLGEAADTAVREARSLRGRSAT